MDTRIIRIADPGGRAAALRAGVETLRRGGVAVIPTDTVYGLAVDGGNRLAVERLYRLKRRPPGKPLVRLLASRRAVLPLLSTPGEIRLLERFWPGPLTVILTTPEGETRGYRMPDHGLVRRLIRESGIELAASSANRSGQPVITSPRAVQEIFAGEVDLIIDDGELSGRASTVLDLSVTPPRLLREGPVGKEELLAVLAEAGSPGGAAREREGGTDE